MKRQKVIFIITTLLFGSFLLCIAFSNFSQIQQINSKVHSSAATEKLTVAAADREQKESNLVSMVEEKKVQEDYMMTGSAVKEERELEADSNNDRQAITEGFKEKIREVVEGTIRLFRKELKVVAIGDSLTQGVGDETGDGGYVGILQHTFEDNHLNISVENYGKRGNRTDQLLKRLETNDIASGIQKADAVIITIGANDVMKVVKDNFTNLTLEPFDNEREEYINRLRAILLKVNELNPEVQIYLVGFYNPFEKYFGDIEEFGVITDSWNAAGKSVTEEFENAAYIPIADLFDHPDMELLAEDHFHPNTSGYKLIAQRVLENMHEVSVDSEIAAAERQ